MTSTDQPETITLTDTVSPLTDAGIERVREGVAAAGDRSVREIITKTLSQLSARSQEYIAPRVNSGIRRFVLRSLIHAFFRVRVENLAKIPLTSAILAANHLHHIDPLVLLAEIPTQPYYYIVGDARTLYNKWWKRLILGFAGGVIPLARIWKEEVAVMSAAQTERPDLTELAQTITTTVPIGTDIHTLRQIDHIVLRILAHGDGMILFPEGRLGEHEGKLHLPLKRGTVIYALKAGVPIVPVALIGTHDLYWRKELTLRIGEPLHFCQTTRPSRQQVDIALDQLQAGIQALLPVNYDEPTGTKLLRYFLNHILW